MSFFRRQVIRSRERRPRRMDREMKTPQIPINAGESRWKNIAAYDYNTARPHSSLGYQTPAAYAADLTATGAQLRNPDQLRRSPVARTAPQGVSTAKALTAAG